MKHIAIDARIINSSTGRYVERLLHYLQDIDLENSYTVLVREKDRDFWKPKRENYTVKVADYDNYSFSEQLGFKKFLDQLNPDLVHFCMPQQPILYRGKTVTTIHDLTLLRVYNSDKNWLMYHLKQLVGRRVFKYVAKKSAHVITPTQFVKDDVISYAGIDSGKVTVTLEAADSPEAEPEKVDLPFSRFIMYLGQYSDYKNIRRLGDAHQKLLTNHPDLGLVLVGKVGKDAQTTKKYFDMNHYKNIVFTGFVSDEQKEWLYQQTSAYVFPSLSEGFGLPGLEAMLAGAPVVSSNATCLPEVYGDAAVYFSPTDTDEMASQIDYVLNNPDASAELIKKGAQQAKKFSWQKMTEQTHQVYMDALHDKN